MPALLIIRMPMVDMSGVRQTRLSRLKRLMVNGQSALLARLQTAALPVPRRELRSFLALVGPRRAMMWATSATLPPTRAKRDVRG